MLGSYMDSCLSNHFSVIKDIKAMLVTCLLSDQLLLIMRSFVIQIYCIISIRHVSSIPNCLAWHYMTLRHDGTLQTHACSYIWETQQTVKISNPWSRSKKCLLSPSRPSPLATGPSPRAGSTWGCNHGSAPNCGLHFININICITSKGNRIVPLYSVSMSVFV